jgi:hypothetical protein
MTSEFNVHNAAGYEQLMGRWSQRLAPPFIEFAGVEDGERILATTKPCTPADGRCRMAPEGQLMATRAAILATDVVGHSRPMGVDEGIE